MIYFGLLTSQMFLGVVNPEACPVSISYAQIMSSEAVKQSQSPINAFLLTFSKQRRKLWWSVHLECHCHDPTTIYIMLNQACMYTVELMTMFLLCIGGTSSSAIDVCWSTGTAGPEMLPELGGEKPFPQCTTN